MEIRPETPEDADAIRHMLNAAFDGTSEALLVELIRESDNYVPGLSLVAVVDGKIVGHVMLSYVTLHGDEPTEVLSLAPLAVAPSHQRRGVGRALVEAALAAADARGEPLVVLEGIPSYYPRFGFEPGAVVGIEKPAPRVPDEAFMVRRLRAYQPTLRGKIVYPPAFHEADAIGP